MSQNKVAATITRGFKSAIWPLIIGVLASVMASWIWANRYGFDFLQNVFNGIFLIFNVMFLFIFPENERVAKQFADGITITIILSLASCLIGTIIGCATAWLLRYARKEQKMVLYNSARYILLNIALTVPLYMMLYFGLFSPIMPRSFPPVIIAIIMLSLNLSFFVTKIVLGGFQVLPTDQIEAARVCGFSNFSVVTQFEIPLLWNAIGNALIVNGQPQLNSLHSLE